MLTLVWLPSLLLQHDQLDRPWTPDPCLVRRQVFEQLSSNALYFDLFSQVHITGRTAWTTHVFCYHGRLSRVDASKIWFWFFCFVDTDMCFDGYRAVLKPCSLLWTVAQPADAASSILTNMIFLGHNIVSGTRVLACTMIAVHTCSRTIARASMILAINVWCACTMLTVHAWATSILNKTCAQRDNTTCIHVVYDTCTLWSWYMFVLWSSWMLALFGGKSMEALMSPINVSWEAIFLHFLYIFTFSLHVFTFSLHVLYIFFTFYTFSYHVLNIFFTFFTFS